MFVIELSKEANKRLIFSGTTFRLQYNIFNQVTDLRSTFGFTPNRATYDWLVENVGHETFNVRKYDLLLFEGEINTFSYPKQPRFETPEEYETENPPLATTAHRWQFVSNSAKWYFTHLEDATLFKLTWA